MPSGKRDRAKDDATLEVVTFGLRDELVKTTCKGQFVVAGSSWLPTEKGQEVWFSLSLERKCGTACTRGLGEGGCKGKHALVFMVRASEPRHLRPKFRRAYAAFCRAGGHEK